MGGMALSMKAGIWVIFFYVILYITYNFFKPTSTATISDLAGKKLRATVFSADSLLQTLVTSILAPFVGYLADHYSIAVTYTVIGAGMLLLNALLLAEWSLGAWC